MEHIEEAGIHSGDSACVIPTFSLSQRILDEISAATKAMAREVNVRGLMNVQFAVKGDDVVMSGSESRASRTIPFVSKAIGHPSGKTGRQRMMTEIIEGSRVHERNCAETFLGERSGVPVSAL